MLFQKRETSTTKETEAQTSSEKFPSLGPWKIVSPSQNAVQQELNSAIQKYESCNSNVDCFLFQKYILN